ncbi:MAG: RluA family pseudouridine synthase [Clostridiales bacterium]|nr:RluA family pseudouridine synthase [Clostridiales bacterium]
MTENALRADSAVAAKLEITRNAAQKLIDGGFVLLGGQPVKKSQKIIDCDELEIFPQPINTCDILPQNIPLEVLYEDEGMAVINKPKGMVTHPAPGHYKDTLVNALMHRFGDSLSGINGTLRPGIVHRLDKDTSGVIAVAKNNFYHTALSAQLASREMSRIYRAIVFGETEHSGTIDKPIGRSKKDRKKMAVVSDGRTAITHYETTEMFYNSGKKYSFIKAKLETGRTHQIRVHFASIGHAVVGDTVYGQEKQPFDFLNGQALHAESISFVHPKSGEIVTVSSALPEYFSIIKK